MPHRIEMNVQTGERKVIELTPEEVADAQARTLAESLWIAPKSREDRLLEKLVEKGILMQAEADLIIKG